MKYLRKLEPIRVAIAVGSLLIAGYAQGQDATGMSGTWYQVEGEANCNAFSSNSVGTFTVLNPSDSGLASDGLLMVDYEVDSSGDLPSVSWTTQADSEAVNAVILVGEKITGKQKSIVYHFGENGSAMDSGEIGPSEGLAKLRFCYGLGPLVTPPPPPLEVIPVCTDIDGELLDLTGVQCPVASPDPEDNSDKRFIFSINPYGQNGEIAVCTCNFDEALTECDASIEAGEEGSCLPFPDQQADEPAKGLTWPPAEIVIYQNGTGACYTTRSGGRICF